MLLFVVIILGLALFTSIIVNILLYIAGNRQMNLADTYKDLYEQYVLQMKDRILQTYLQMKQLDNTNGFEGIFSKDDEVGQAYKEILDILQELNEVTQEENLEEGE